MNDTTIDKYIAERYERWLDYSKYHSERQGLYGLEHDLLNHVLMYILERMERQEEYRGKVHQMLESKKGKWTEFDFHVLSIIKFNAESDTAPFKREYDLYQPAGTYPDVDFQRLDIIDDRDESIEREQDLQDKERRFKEACDVYGLSEKAKAIFHWKFIDGNNLTDWPYEEDAKKLYAIYNGVLQLVKDKINGHSLF